MNCEEKPPSVQTHPDVMHFEALGPEAVHLEEETVQAKQRGELPEHHVCIITGKTVQEFLKENGGVRLPDIITTKTHSLLPEEYLSGNKKSVITRSAGYDHFEDLADRANIASLREYCVNAVAQTAMKLLYAAAGMLNHYTKATATFDRQGCRAFMELTEQRVLTVFGVGRIGKRVYDLAYANGLTVRGVDIRQEELNRLYGGTVRFVSKEEAITSSDIVVNAMNLTRNRKSRFFNLGYFSRKYIAKAEKPFIFINVTRGEIAPESVLLDAYTTGKIIGIGLDVFSSEARFTDFLRGVPCEGEDIAAARTIVERALEGSANIYVQPHQGFNSDVAAKAKAVEAIRHLVAWYRNGGAHFDEQLPYY